MTTTTSRRARGLSARGDYFLPGPEYIRVGRGPHQPINSELSQRTPAANTPSDSVDFKLKTADIAGPAHSPHGMCASPKRAYSPGPMTMTSMYQQRAMGRRICRHRRISAVNAGQLAESHFGDSGRCARYPPMLRSGTWCVDRPQRCPPSQSKSSPTCGASSHKRGRRYQEASTLHAFSRSAAPRRCAHTLWLQNAVRLESRVEHACGGWFRAPWSSGAVVLIPVQCPVSSVSPYPRYGDDGWPLTTHSIEGATSDQSPEGQGVLKLLGCGG